MHEVKASLGEPWNYTHPHLTELLTQDRYSDIFPLTISLLQIYHSQKFKSK